MLELNYREAVTLSEILIRTKRAHVAALAREPGTDRCDAIRLEIAVIEALVPRLVTQVILRTSQDPGPPARPGG